MKLFIYYSLTGNLDKVAQVLKEKDIEIRKVEMKKKMPKSFFFRVLTGGFLSGINAKSKLKDYDKDIISYDEIIIGSPIWNGRFSSPVNRLLKDLELDNKKLSFVFTSGSGEGKKALDKVNKLYPNSKVIFLKEPLKYENELEKLQEL